MHLIEEDLEGGVEGWAEEVVEAFEQLLAKHAAFAAYLAEHDTHVSPRLNG